MLLEKDQWVRERLQMLPANSLKAAGLTTGPKGLRTYLNMFDKLGRRPKPADFKKVWVVIQPDLDAQGLLDL